VLCSRYFPDLTQPEIAAQLRKNPLVIFPAGSVEQHGPHLPAGTDSFAALTIACAVAQRMDALVLPCGALGVTPLHMAYESTLTLTPETFQRVVVETCSSAARHGAKCALLLNWHEGNIPSLALAAEALYRENGMKVLTVQACYVADELFGAEYGGLTHGGQIEALAVLASHPSLVRLERARNCSGADGARKMDALRRSLSYQPVLGDIRVIAPNGWYGDPQQATAEKAGRMVEAIADAIAKQAGSVFLAMDRVFDLATSPEGDSPHAKVMR
jgi:creatinine amidohydrolase